MSRASASVWASVGWVKYLVHGRRASGMLSYICWLVRARDCSFTTVLPTTGYH
jgi:hypothetical protein